MDRYERTILFVDDDEHFLNYLAESFQQSGYRVITKTNGSAALSILDGGTSVDLVVADYVMPGMNGLEFIAAVKKRTLSVQIVLLTAHCDVDVYFKAMNLGVYDVTSKPISMSVLRAIVKTALIYPVAGGNKIAQGTSDATAMA